MSRRTRPGPVEPPDRRRGADDAATGCPVDCPAADRPAAARACVARPGTEAPGADRPGAACVGAARSGTDGPGAARPSADRPGAARSGTGTVGTGVARPGVTRSAVRGGAGVVGGFTRWRRSCPFTAGVLTASAGVELVAVVGTARCALRFGGAGVTASWVLGALLFAAGLMLLCLPALRHFAGVTAVVAGVLSLLQANLGGFLVGFVLAALGGALAVAWVPRDERVPED